jgi:uncharacterized protein (TIGR03083 family)
VTSDATGPAIEEHIERLRIEGELFADVAAHSPFDARVPGCPDWDLEDLVRHLADVHRWAAMIIRERLPDRPHRDFEGPSDPAELLAWYRDGLAQLVDALVATVPTDSFWAWAPAPSPLAFWARRQDHETTIHRLDAEQATGATTPFAADFAADGVDEWLAIVGARVKVPGGDGRTMHLSSTDTGHEWRVTLDAVPTTERGASGGDVSVRAPAGDLFPLVMNRRTADGLHVTGDRDVLRFWRDHVRF